MTDVVIHAFEKAGLGRAPFRCVGLASIPSSSLAEHNPTAYNNAMAMLPKGLGCGTCDFCGTAIMHNFIIQGSGEADKRFVVGSDCVARTGDAGLVKQTRGERLKVVREKRELTRAQGRAERAAFWAAERKSRAEAFAHEHAALVQRAAPYMADGGFISDVITKALEGRYTDRSLAAVERVIGDLERRALNRLNSRHVSEVGKRSTWAVTVDRVASYDRPCFGASWRNETVWIITMRDEAGNALVSKSSSFHAQKGEAFKIKATVKAHTEFDGEKQTQVQRIVRS